MVKRLKSSRPQAGTPPDPQPPPTLWHCLLLGLVIGWGGVGGTGAIIGFQDGGAGTAANYFLRGLPGGILLGLFVGLATYLGTRGRR